MRERKKEGKKEVSSRAELCRKFDTFYLHFPNPALREERHILETVSWHRETMMSKLCFSSKSEIIEILTGAEIL